MFRRLIARGFRPLALLFGMWLFALVLETAPHLVHHLFDEDQASTCEFLVVADHEPGIAGAPSDGPVGLPARERAIDLYAPHAPIASVEAANSRAPPLAFLARL